MAVLFAKQGIDYFMKLYAEIIEEERRIPDIEELKQLMYNKIEPTETKVKSQKVDKIETKVKSQKVDKIETKVKSTKKEECGLMRDTRIKQSTLMDINVIVPFMPNEILYTGCKALKLYPSSQGKREGLFLPCCNPVGTQDICTFCAKAGLVEKYGELNDRLRQKDTVFIAKNHKQEVPYDKWISESKKYTIETIKQRMKDAGLKLSIFQDKRRERTPSTSSDEEDKYSVERTIIYNDVEYYVTFSKTICTQDGDVVGRYDDDGEAIWNI